MKEKVIKFIKDFILMGIIITIVKYVSYKLNVVNEFGYSYIIGFMIGWSIWQIIKLLVDNKNKK